MINKSLKKNEMPVQAAEERNKNFKEVALGYTAEQAIDEAQRCLNCKNMPGKYRYTEVHREGSGRRL